MTDRDPRTAQFELWMSQLTPSRAADLSNDEEKHRQPLHSSKLPEWPTLTERTSVLGIRILLFIHRHCGALPFRIVLRMVNAVYWFSSPRLRAVVCDYQQRVDRAAPFLLKDFGTSAHPPVPDWPSWSGFRWLFLKNSVRFRGKTIWQRSM